MSANRPLPGEAVLPCVKQSHVLQKAFVLRSSKGVKRMGVQIFNKTQQMGMVSETQETEERRQSMTSRKMYNSHLHLGVGN